MDLAVWKHRYDRRLFWLIPVLALVLAGLFVVLCWWQGWFWFRQQAMLPNVGRPGAAEGDAGNLVVASSVADEIENRLLLLLQDGGRLAAWYRLAGRTGLPAAERAADILADDQLRYGQYLLEQKRQKEFQVWWNDFRAAFRDDSGLFLLQPVGHADDETAAADHWRTNLTAARLLAQSVSLWPDAARLADLKQLSDQLLTRLAAGLPTDYLAAVPTDRPILDPAATPTPKPTLAPDPDEGSRTSLAVLRLASLDLFAMQQLSALDQRWQAYYDQALALVEGGYLGDFLPLYAFASEADQQGYLPYPGDVPAVATEEALLTLLHLCEIRQLPERSLSWLKDELYNEGALYESYHITQGSPVNAQECLPAYAMVARIARIIQDPDLYQIAIDRLLWHQATSQKSAALAAIYRQTATDQVFVWANDNIWALLALR